MEVVLQLALQLHGGERGIDLRQILPGNSIDLYNNDAKVINCWEIHRALVPVHLVRVEGQVSSANRRDAVQRSLPPHSPTIKLRLAYQNIVLGSKRITKFDGFWGQGSQIVWIPKG